MKHLPLIIVSSLLLAGCIDSTNNAWGEKDYSTSEKKFAPICLDGVEYWARASGHKGYLAVRIDPETLKPKRCKM